MIWEIILVPEVHDWYLALDDLGAALGPVLAATPFARRPYDYADVGITTICGTPRCRSG